MSKKNRNRQEAAEQKLEQAVVAVEEVKTEVKTEPVVSQLGVSTAESELAEAEIQVNILIGRLSAARKHFRELKNGPVSPAASTKSPRTVRHCQPQGSGRRNPLSSQPFDLPSVACSAIQGRRVRPE
jgi:hypothetical protein